MTQIPPRFSHYQALRRDNPDLFYKLTTQRQMRDSYVTLGAAFFDAYAQAGAPMKDILSNLRNSPAPLRWL